jgi:hypothetical protein
MAMVRRYAWRVLPLLLLLGLYWPGLTNWFYQDDFGWLNLRRELHSVRDLGPALFAPKAHGNMRPLGENAYFLVFSSLFGVDALPFRIWAFATQMASLVLLGSVVSRMTSSPAAGFWAQILWIANTGLAPAMCWTSIYNQILSGFFFLLAFYLLLRQAAGGERRYYIWQWAAFLLGLGALETNVMYPAIAAVYTLLFARAYFRKILPMFLASALAIFAHFRFAPPQHEGVYALHFDRHIFSTLGGYWMRALGPSQPAAMLLSCAVAALLVWEARRRVWAGLFGVAWFVIVMCPYLPLSAHQEDYYLAVPAIGLAMLGASAIACAWRSRIAWRVAAVASCVAVYLGTSLPATWALTRWHHQRGTRVEDLVLGVAEIHQAEPGKEILLAGIDTDLFWSGIADAPFRVMEIPHVYLAPGSEARIQGPPGLVAKYVLPQGLALRALREGRAVVYQADGVVLRNATARYRALAETLWKAEPPRFINLGDTVYAEYLGAGWSTPADGYRWLLRTGTLHLGGPRGPTDRLYVYVFGDDQPRLGIRVDGTDLAPQLIERSNGMFSLAASLPAAMDGTEEIEVVLSSARPTLLKFGFVEIR